MKEDRTLFRKCLDMVMKHEGWLLTSNDPTDRGGLTYCGITQGVYDEWCKENEMPEGKVYDMAGDVLEDIYYGYWNSCKCQTMKPKIAYYVFDMAVNMGSGRSKRILQKSIKSIGHTITVDGDIGMMTLKLIDSINEDLLLKHLVINRKQFYNNIIEKNPSQKKFINGWLKRAEVVYEG